MTTPGDSDQPQDDTLRMKTQLLRCNQNVGLKHQLRPHKASRRTGVMLADINVESVDGDINQGTVVEKNYEGNHQQQHQSRITLQYNKRLMKPLNAGKTRQVL
jgi:hypothetical protein